MKIVWALIGAPVGLVLGVVAGFGVALLAMYLFEPPRTDGTYGMRQVIVCVPVGALVGLAGGLWWALRTR